MRQLLISAMLILWTLSFSQERSLKKGVAYGYHTYEDMAVLSESLSWWYNWYHQPDAGVFDTYQSLGMAFVPMAWNGDFDETALRAYLDDHPDVEYLLGFNEPNFVSQANMTPVEAAAIWPVLESLAADYDLKLVAPAVNYCDVCVDIPGTSDDSDPTAWLDAFFTACSGCQVDYIAVHWYACDVAALDWYIGRFDKYGLPLWVTEIACWEGTPTQHDQLNYMIGAIDLMEFDDRIHRYAWFSGRSNGPFNSLLGAEPGSLTPTGEMYVSFNPSHDTTQYTLIPARIEAEDYTRMQGILIEATSDVDGFANIGWTDAGDWLEFNIEVPTADTYPLVLRAAGQGTGAIELQVDGELVQEIAIPSTGGWQIWNTVEAAIDLPEGKHRLRLFVKTAGFNLNWLHIGDATVFVHNPDRDAVEGIYPQPLSTNPLYIQFKRVVHGDVLFQLHSLTGEIVYSCSTIVQSDHAEVHMPDHVLDRAGLYILSVRLPDGTSTMKVLVPGSH